MFRLLSKETNIFSVPIYIGILLIILITTNLLSFGILNIISNVIAFMGLGLGYILFGRIALNRNAPHLPLFLYTIFILSIYPKLLDIGISITLITNSILLFFLTDDHPKLRENSYLLIGSILATNFIFLPTTWSLFVFVIMHIISTSDKILSNILKLLLGGILIFLGYFCLMYFLDYHQFNINYIPPISPQFNTDISELYFIIPTAIFCILAIADHFINFNKKSPRSKFKYSFILAYLCIQCLTIFLYMGKNYEYLLLILFPISIILSRFLRFLNTSWLQEISLWIIIISYFFSFKFNSFFILL